MSLKEKYAIAGVGYTPQGRIPGRTSLSFCLEAASNAIKDAGLRREDIDGLISYRHFPPCAGGSRGHASPGCAASGSLPDLSQPDAN
jgi:3-oxoacyl-[acyl-carrier-protein] synthase III